MGVLDEIVSEEQPGFVPGRLIIDNVLVALSEELKKGKVGACAVKFDMANAYDRVEWSYLRAVMINNFVDLIMKCVEIVSFQVRVNGKLSTPFSPSRGI